MLVVTRKKGQDIDITTPSGEKLVVRITQIKGKQCRVGIMCRREVDVDRHDGFRTKEQDAKVYDIINGRLEL